MPLTQSKVLMVEDVPEVRLMMRQVLARLGVTVLEAANGHEGVEQARSERPDLILMDLSLPVMDGWAAMEALKASPATSGIPIVVVTAEDASPYVARARQLGCEGWITKPVDTARLSQFVTSLLLGEFVTQEGRW